MYNNLTYNISVSPNVLNFNQVNDTPTSQNINFITTVSGASSDPITYKIRLLVYTDNYGFDLWEVDGNTEIDLGSGGNYTGSASIKTRGLSNLPNGYYTGGVTVMLLKITPDNPTEIVISKDVNFTLTVNQPTDYNFLINKTEDTIHHLRSNNTSTISAVTITSDTDFTVSGAAFIQVNNEALPKTFPAGTRTINFKAVANNQLEYGLNTTTLSFKKGNLTLASLLLNVVQTNTNQLEVSTDQLSFSHLEAVGFSEWQYLTVYAPGAITFTKPNWLEVVLDSNIANVRIYKIRSISDEDLELGNYTGILLFTSGSVTAEVNLNFELYDYWNSNFNKKLHFTKDQENLILYAYQRNVNNYIKLHLTGSILDSLRNNTVIDVIQNLYYFNNQTKFDIGKYLHKYFDLYQNQNLIFDLFNSNFNMKKLYEFAKFNITISEYSYDTDTIVYSYNIPQQLFLKGHKPKTLNSNYTGFISNSVNKTCRITPEGKLIASFISENNTDEIKFYVNAELIVTKPANNLDQLGIYALYIDLKDLEVLPGNLIDVVYGTQSLKYQVIPASNYSYHILYIDYWGNPKLFEMTGGFSFLPKAINKTYRDSNNHLKRTNVDEDLILNWNTGFYFKNDIINIKEIMLSKKCWILKNNELIEIIPTTEDYEMFSTDNFLYSSELQFHINAKDYDTCFTN